MIVYWKNNNNSLLSRTSSFLCCFVIFYLTITKQRIYGFQTTPGIVASNRRHAGGVQDDVFPSWKQQKQLHRGRSTTTQVSLFKSSSVLPVLRDKSSGTMSTSPARRRQKSVIEIQKSALFASTLTRDDSKSDGKNIKKLGFFAKLRWLFLFPIRLLILYPLNLFAEAIVEDLIADGTTATTATTTATTSDGSENSNNSLLQTSDTNVLESSSSSSSSTVANKDNMMTSTTTAAVMEEETTTTTKNAGLESKKAGLESSTAAAATPLGDRWAVCSEGIDLSGKWEIVVDEEFKTQYDHYLASLGQPLIVRTVAVNIVHNTKEDITQKDNGKYIFIRGTNVRGIWDRVYISSGADSEEGEYERVQVPVMTADSEQVEAEAWWEDHGQTHVSWLRGVKKYGGGAFESRRYLDDEGVYVCESTFHPEDTSKDRSSLVWRFRKVP